MTAQDIDLKQFTAGDLQKLRDTIDKSSGKSAAVKVCSNLV
jgi:hypothetical protein